MMHKKTQSHHLWLITNITIMVFCVSCVTPKGQQKFNDLQIYCSESNSAEFDLVKAVSCNISNTLDQPVVLAADSVAFLSKNQSLRLMTQRELSNSNVYTSENAEDPRYRGNFHVTNIGDGIVGRGIGNSLGSSGRGEEVLLVLAALVVIVLIIVVIDQAVKEANKLPEVDLVHDEITLLPKQTVHTLFYVKSHEPVTSMSFCRKAPIGWCESVSIDLPVTAKEMVGRHP